MTARARVREVGPVGRVVFRIGSSLVIEERTLSLARIDAPSRWTSWASATTTRSRRPSPSSVKADAGLRATPVLMVTAGGHADERLSCQQSGCDGILTKPINRHTFLAAVRGHLHIIERRRTGCRRGCSCAERRAARSSRITA